MAFCKLCKMTIERELDILKKFKICQNCVEKRAGEITYLVNASDIDRPIIFYNSLKLLGDNKYGVTVQIGDLILLKAGLIYLSYSLKSLQKNTSMSVEQFLAGIASDLSVQGDQKNSQVIALKEEAEVLRESLQNLSLPQRYGLLRTSQIFPAWDIVGSEPSTLHLLSPQAVMFSLNVNPEGSVYGLKFLVGSASVDSFGKQLADWFQSIAALRSSRVGSADEVAEIFQKVAELSPEQSMSVRQQVETICEDGVQVRYLANKLMGRFGPVSFLKKFNFGKSILTGGIIENKEKCKPLEQEICRVLRSNAKQISSIGLIFLVIGVLATLWSIFAYEPVITTARADLVGVVKSGHNELIYLLKNAYCFSSGYYAIIN
jgi:hypothetical protein